MDDLQGMGGPEHLLGSHNGSSHSIAGLCIPVLAPWKERLPRGAI